MKQTKEVEKMARIKQLSKHLINQIAAGEVIERPASVVKELTENSIDAGATRVSIEITNECRDIRVADNGCGIHPDDIMLAFSKHATSKIQEDDDLFDIHTLGFRGEALASIISIAKLTLAKILKFIKPKPAVQLVQLWILRIYSIMFLFV